MQIIRENLIIRQFLTHTTQQFGFVQDRPPSHCVSINGTKALAKLEYILTSPRVNTQPPLIRPLPPGTLPLAQG
jgi:hypothetical protein